jgi:hypothetical protein
MLGSFRFLYGCLLFEGSKPSTSSLYFFQIHPGNKTKIKEKKEENIFFKIWGEEDTK